MKKRLRMGSCLLAMSLMLVSAAGGCGGASKDASGAAMQESDGASTDMNGASPMDGFAGGIAMGSEDWNTEEYHAEEENGFLDTTINPLSTFSADVDTASYSNVRRMLNEGTAPEDIPKGAVRLEEMVNYFHYDYDLPQGEEPFGVTIDGTVCPWNEEHGLLRIGIRTEEVDFSESPKSNLVFLLDVSGSMDMPNKLPLLKQAFAMLADNLGEKDRVSIVTYAGYDQVVLAGARGDEKGKILQALACLEAGGGTNGSAGIETAYDLAEQNFIQGGNNRVILATDGDLNIGQTSESELKSLIERKRKSGVYLSVLGFGEGNLKDNKMETLADAGNGNYAYIDSLMEAKRVMVDELGSTLVTVAEDVKFQVEFNPAHIAKYRLLGYENRLLAAEDFTDDTKDAGEIGAGHTVTVLYEVVWAGEESGDSIDLRYQQTAPTSDEEAQKEWATLKIRYKEPGKSKSQEWKRGFGGEVYQENIADANMLLEASAAEFALLLYDSDYKGESSYGNIMGLWDGQQYGGSKEVSEFLELVQTAAKLDGELCGLPTCGMADGPVRINGSDGVELSSMGTMASNAGVFTVKNMSDDTWCYGAEYSLEKKENGEWVPLKQKDAGWDDIAYVQDPGSQREMILEWEFVYGNLPVGDYRVTKTFWRESGPLEDLAERPEVTLQVEFSIEEESVICFDQQA